MANLYTPESLGIKAPAGGFQTGGWYGGRQYWNGQFSDANVINPLSNQAGAGAAVNPTVVAASAAAQGKTPDQMNTYLNKQNANNPTPAQTVDPASLNPTNVNATAGVDASGTGLNLSTPVAALNLPDLYKSLSDSAGISDMEKELTTKETAFNDAMSKINDDPYMSESIRVGRGQKLTTDYNNSIKTVQDGLAMKKQDIQTQLDLQTKQFDINSQKAKAALDQFNTLLQSGALSGASGNDIAAITKATGISSTEIQAAINAQKTKDVTTSVSTVDDGSNVYSVVINSKTGEIISKNKIATSKPSTVGTTPGTAAYKATQEQALNQFIVSKTNSYGNIGPADWNAALNAYLAAGLGTRNDFILTYAAWADPNRGDFEQPSGYNFPKSIRDQVVSGKTTVSKPTTADAIAALAGGQ